LQAKYTRFHWLLNIIRHNPAIPFLTPLVSVLVSARRCVVGAPALRDESGFGFGANTAENPKPLWSRWSIPRSDETLPAEWSGKLGAVQRWRSSVASGSWGEQVLGKIASKKTVIIMLFFPSLARGPGGFWRDGTSTQAERRPGWRGMQAAKFGHDHPANYFKWNQMEKSQ